jgi:hypothetical protein
MKGFGFVSGYSFVVPFEVQLKHPSGWRSDSEYEYAVARLFIHLEQGKKMRPLRHGEVLCEITVTEDVEGVNELYEEIEVTISSEKETVSEFVRLQEEISSAVADVSARVKAAGWEIGPSLRKEIRERFSFTCKSSTTHTSGRTRRTTRSVRQTFTSREGRSSENVLVATYRETEWHMYITGIDFLRVEYRKSSPVTRKRFKFPKNPDTNHVQLACAYADLKTWRLTTPPYPLIKASEWVQQVEDPHSIDVTEPTTTMTHPMGDYEGETLYRISNAVFPLTYRKFKKKWETRMAAE